MLVVKDKKQYLLNSFLAKRQTKNTYISGEKNVFKKIKNRKCEIRQ